MSFSVQSVIGNYRILSLLGSGGMGEVYLAEDIRLRRRVALKRLPKVLGQDLDGLRRLEHEALAIAALNHPNIVTIYGIDEIDGTLVLSMELVEGQTLRELIPAQGLDLETLDTLVPPLLAAVGAAHRRGIVHRDLKSSNVMITDDGLLKVLDFGVAMRRSIDHDKERTTHDMSASGTTGELIGTVPYMAPECLEGQLASEKSDIFSLGVLIYEAASGSRPFQGESLPLLLSAILRDDPVPLARLRPDLSEAYVQVVAQCLQKDPGLRFETCEEIAAELTRAKDVRHERRRDSRQSIAVLPFADLSAEKDHDYFCQGIAEELISALGRVQSLEVKSRTSSLRFKNTELDVCDVGRRLGVRTVLEGSVRKAGSRLRISAQLVKVADGFQLWSERFDRELDDVFAIQDEIAEATVAALRGVLTESDREALSFALTVEPQAYDLYLRGRYDFYRKRRESLTSARQRFERAIELDPEFGLAHSGVANCSSFLYQWFGNNADDLETADQSSARAVELDPESPIAHASRGLALSIAERDEQADAEFRKALELDPASFEPLYLYARLCFSRGDLQHAAELFERAASVRSEDYQSVALLGLVYRALGHDDDVGPTLRRAMTRARRALALDPEDARALYLGGGCLVALGEPKAGLKWAEKARALAPDDPFVLWNVAAVQSTAGRLEAAIATLEQAFELGFGHRAWVERDPDMDPLRDHPRFRALLSKLR